MGRDCVSVSQQWCQLFCQGLTYPAETNTVASANAQTDWQLATTAATAAVGNNDDDAKSAEQMHAGKPR